MHLEQTICCFSNISIHCMWNHLEMLIEVVWVPCIEVEGTSRGHARYLAHLVHLLLMVMMMMVLLMVVVVMMLVMVMRAPLGVMRSMTCWFTINTNFIHPPSPLYNCVAPSSVFMSATSSDPIWNPNICWNWLLQNRYNWKCFRYLLLIWLHDFPSVPSAALFCQQQLQTNWKLNFRIEVKSSCLGTFEGSCKQNIIPNFF